jgi:hypothetical protein
MFPAGTFLEGIANASVASSGKVARVTRILAFSDIHNNVNAVRQLRARESNDYDALIVAGDIGSSAANEIFDVLRTFECPVLYVFGNWDRRLEHDRNFGIAVITSTCRPTLSAISRLWARPSTA